MCEIQKYVQYTEKYKTQKKLIDEHQKYLVFNPKT